MTSPVNPVTAGARAAESAVRTVFALPEVVPGVGELAGVVDSLAAARRWMGDRHNWIRVLWVMSGFAFVVTGVTWMARKPITQAVTGTAATVVTKGKA